jgi:LPXTG-motif cell wall-anchored protein
MYTLSDVTPVVATGVAAVVLPNTGVVTNNIVAVAAAVVVGMLTWGVMYARANR